jgi:outer membrane protein assembly factor BamB
MLATACSTKDYGEKRMQILKNRKVAIATVIVLIIAMSASMTLLPNANAHTPIWTFASYAYLTVQPDPVGVGQTVAVVMWIDGPLPGATVSNDVRRHDYKLTITDPTGQTEVKTWGVVSDTTSVQYMQYTPSRTGNYTFKFEYPEQTYTWTGAYNGDIFHAASTTVDLTVQEAPITPPVDSYPLPTEYWTRPIEGENSYWYTVASNWLASPYILGAGAAYGIPGAYQPDGAAPNSAHVMWTRPIQWGGVVGGTDTGILGEMWYSGLSYNTRFSNPIIMNGVLYYPEPWGNGATGGDYVAVNLQTGQELWRINASATGVSLIPSFGYMYALETENQHGILPNGILIASQTVSGQGTVWRAYDARTGVLTTMNITNVPSGTSIAGPQGEIYRYTLTNLGTSTSPNYYLTQWNSSKVFGGASGVGVSPWYTGTVNASTYSGTTNRYDWNISLSSLKGTSWSIGSCGLGAIPMIAFNDKIVLTQGSFGGHPGDYMATVSLDPGNITVVDLKPTSRGSIIFSQTYQPAPGNNSRLITDWDPANNIFIFDDKETQIHYGYSLSTGQQVWQAPEPTDETVDWNFMAQCLERIAYGKLYVTGYAGILYCYDDKTGNLLWTYGNGGEGNSTLSGFITPYGRYPIFVSTIADGKVYLTTTEHSPNSPLYKDSYYRCVNATNGTEIWKLRDYGNQMYGGQAPIADGYLATLNSYDSQIYCIGRGPSKLTVTAPDLAAAAGQAVVIRGTITDIASGTKQTEQAGRFPNGVPAMSDSSMTEWMAYVYQQKPMATTVKGVDVSIDVLDVNGNYRNIGVATSDANGVYSLPWTPDISGNYMVFATFAGTNGYYPAHAETSFAAMSATPTPTPSPQPLSPAPVEMYFAISTIAIIVAIAAATVLIVAKKK